jgi:hypothetical protein
VVHGIMLRFMSTKRLLELVILVLILVHIREDRLEQAQTMSLRQSPESFPIISPW